MAYLERTSFEKIGEKHPAFKDESGDIKKVIIVRRKIINYFGVYYDIVDPTVRSTKKL